MKKHLVFFPQFLSVICALLLAALACVQGICPAARVAAAAGAESENHRTLSSAKSLSAGTSCRLNIAAHDTVCLYSAARENLTFTVKSDALSSLSIELLSESGTSLEKNASTKNNVCTICPSASACQNNNRLFLRLTSNTSETAAVTVSAKVAETQNSAPKKQSKDSQSNSSDSKKNSGDKQKNGDSTEKTSADSSAKKSSSPSNGNASSSASSSSSLSSSSALSPGEENAEKTSSENNNTASSSAGKNKNKKTSEKKKKEKTSDDDSDTPDVTLSPQVCFLDQGKSFSLSVLTGNEWTDSGDFTWKSTDSKVVTVKQDGTMIARKPGVAVITATAVASAEKDSGKNRKSACLVRVI